MNWYKKVIISTHNIKIPEEIYGDIDEISNIVTNYRLSKKNENEVIGQLNFINPYTKQNENINIAIIPQNDQYKNSIANYKDNLITIFPYHLITNQTNFQILFNAYKLAITHEVTHAIDPKLKINNYTKNINQSLLFSRDDEFDAYSNQIKNDILNNFTPENEKLLRSWLSSADALNLPLFIKHYDIVIKDWLNNNPQYVKKLKTRLYNELFGE